MKTTPFQYLRRRRKRWSKAALLLLSSEQGYRGWQIFNPQSQKDWMELEKKLTAKVHHLYGGLLDNDTSEYTQKTADAEVERDVCRQVIGILYGHKFNTF